MRTPSGAIARIIATYPNVGECLVLWPNGEQARFRSTLLKPMPGIEL